MEIADVRSELDSYEIVDSRDSRTCQAESSDGKSGDINSVKITERRAYSLDSGVPLNSAETFLAKRVRDLQQENDELRKAIQENDEALELCLSNLNAWKDEQKDSHIDLLKKHNQAKQTVSNLQSEIINLKQQLEDKEKCLSEAEAIIAEHFAQKYEERGCLQQEDALLKSVKSVLENEFGCFQESDKQVVNLSGDNKQKLAAPGSMFFEDLVRMCKDFEKKYEPFVSPAICDPSIKEDSKLDVITALKEELSSVKTDCNVLEDTLKQEKEKRLEVEKQNQELQKIIELNSAVTSMEKSLQMGGLYSGKGNVDVKELEEELQLMKKDVEKLDMVRAGHVSHSSETTEESLANLESQNESDERTESLAYEEERRTLKEKIEKHESERAMMDKHVAFQVSRLEKALEEKQELQGQLICLKEEKVSTEKELQEAARKIEKLEMEKDNQEDSNAIQELVDRLREQELSQELQQKQLNDEITRLKSQVCSFYQELQEKERESEQWSLHERELQQRNKTMDLALLKVKEDLKLRESALAEQRNELSSVYAQNEKLLAENQLQRGASGTEVAEYKSKIDNLTAQLLSAEEMVENKEQDYRKLQRDHTNLMSELETVPLLKQQIEVFQTDFATEQQTRQKREEDCKRMREELNKLRAEKDQLLEDLNDPTGSKMAELQRRHGLGGNANNPDSVGSSWNALYDRFLAPRGPPGRNVSPQRQQETDLSRQVSGGRCPKCDRLFPALDALQIHVVECLESENTSSAGERVCPKCQESFPDLDTLQIHVMECIDN